MKKSTIALLVFIYILAFFTGFVLGKNYQKELFFEKQGATDTTFKEK